MMIPPTCTQMLVLVFGIISLSVSGTDENEAGSLVRIRRQSSSVHICYRLVNISKHGDHIFKHGQVLCDGGDGGGWIVILRRSNGGVDFNRPWDDYKYGFGNIKDEFWMGHNFVHLLTKKKSNQLRVDMVYKRQTYFAKYYDFKIGPESDNFRLSVASFVGGTAGDSLSYHNNSIFSTLDKDNSRKVHGTNCMSYAESPWWYYYCQRCLLFGQWGTEEFGKGINWKTVTGYTGSLEAVEMKLRPDTY